MEQMKKMPLEGIRVVELATVVAAPTASRVLCAFGAEVIKVETKIGDEMRRAGEFEMVVCEDDKNPLFTIQNSGKRLTSIDLKNPDGKAAFLKLLETADVFLTNVRLPSLGRLGLDYETLHKAYPGLVYAHFSGFGPKGPDAAKPGFDSTAFWLRSGPMADWQVPGSFPFTPTYAFGDMATSSAFLSGILMAIIGKKSTGMGTFVSTSLFASGIWCNAIGVVSHQPQFGGERPRAAEVCKSVRHAGDCRRSPRRQPGVAARDRLRRRDRHAAQRYLQDQTRRRVGSLPLGKQRLLRAHAHHPRREHGRAGHRQRLYPEGHLQGRP